MRLQPLSLCSHRLALALALAAPFALLPTEIGGELSDQAGRGGVDVGADIGKQDPPIGQGAGHAVERERKCGHATSRDAVGSLHARGGKDTGRQTDGGASLAHAGIPHYTGDWLSRGQYRFAPGQGSECTLFNSSPR